MALRYDEATTIEPVRLPSGALRIDSRTTRVGVFSYRLADGSTRREWRPEEEVFAEESLATLRGAAVTDLHPVEPVTPESWPKVAKGHVGDDVRADGGFVAASIVVHALDLIEAIERKDRREISLGYDCDLEETSGTTPEGEPYDVIQRRIRYNHAALGPEGWGRAGPSVRLRLDGSEEPCSPPSMLKITIGGVEHEIPEPVGAELQKLEDEAKTARRRADALEAEIPKRVSDRVRLQEEATKRRIKYDAAMGDDELIASIVAKAFPTLPLEKLALSHEQLMAMLEAAAGVPAEAPATDAAEPPKDPPAPPAAPPSADEPRMDAAAVGRPPLPTEPRTDADVSPIEAAQAKARERNARAYLRSV